MKRSPIPAPPQTLACRVRFGHTRCRLDPHSTPPELQVALPVLAGAEEDGLLASAEAWALRSDWTVFQAGDLAAGFAVADPARDLEAATGELYRQMLAATRGAYLYRIWNYVPHIHAIEQNEENYHRFCRGRSLAFEEHFGAGFSAHLPAASAVGTRHGPLAIAFIAGRSPPRHHENPQQVPAFAYPRQYGPRAPSFARATVAPAGEATLAFVSGTAAIRGHATVAAGQLDRQLDCTLDNLRIITAVTGVPATARRAFRVYLRRAEDLPHVQARLTREWLQPADSVQYLQADICRADLLLEIEAILTVPGVVEK